MNCYYIVLSKDKKLDAKTIRQRLESGFISLELDKKDAIDQPLNKDRDISSNEALDKMIETLNEDHNISANKKLEEAIEKFLEMQVGDLVLIINNKKPVALVRIVDHYSFNKKYKPHYQHRYAIGVLTYFSDLNSFSQSISPNKNILHLISDNIFGHIRNKKGRFRNREFTRNDIEIKKFYKNTVFPKPYLRMIRIRNFKNFPDLSIPLFKNINIITGKNNAGKTNLLEACYIYLKSQSGSSTGNMELIDIIKMRKISCNKKNNINPDDTISILDILSYRTANKDATPSIRLNSLIGAEFYFSKNSPERVDASFNNHLSEMIRENRIFFITPHLVTNTTLIELFSKIQLLRKRDFLNKAISDNFGKHVEEFDIIEGKPKLYISENKNGWVACSEFGDGIKRFITILSAIWVCSDGVCFIDEIENGFHYTLHDKLWKLVITASKEANCQLFISSHSAEIIHSFNKVAKELQETDISLIRLFKNKDGDIKHISYDAAMLDNELWQEHEVRGW